MKKMKVKNSFKFNIPVIIAGLLMVSVIGCTDKLDEPFENETFTSDVDYTIGENMILPLLGAYQGLYTRGWEEPVTLGPECCMAGAL
jgi:hypothetical protein